MQWTSVISRLDAASEAVAEAIDQTWRQIDRSPDLVVVFASRHHASRVAEIPSALARAFEGATIVGCLAESVIGAGEEEESRPAISVTAAVLPDVRLTLRHLPNTSHLNALDEIGDDVRALMLVLDRQTTDPQTLISALDERFPDVEKFGGLASAGIYPGSNVLFVGDRLMREGAAVLAMAGDVSVDTIVAQGCRPIGPPLIVEHHRDNTILRFDRGTPQQVLEEIYQSLPPEDQRHIPSALHIGVQLEGDGFEDRYRIRPINGIDPNSGALAAGLQIHVGDVVRFQLRDAGSASNDLRARVSERLAGPQPAPAGVLLFSCIERGEQLFRSPNHDSTMFMDAFGDVPLGGFFCAGEFGTLGEETLLHFYTSSFAMFRPRHDS